MTNSEQPSGPLETMSLADFDLRALPPAFYRNPYPLYRRLQAESPIHPLPDGGWFLTRYADLESVYRDTTTFSSDKRVEFKPKFGDSPLFEHHTNSLVFNDPPLHTRVRKIISSALTPRAISEMEPGLERLVGQLLDAMAGKPVVDLIDDFASAIPLEIIGNLLDVPVAERGPLRGWSLAILGALEPSISDAAFEAGNRAVVDFVDYLKGLVADRRARPGDPQRDVLTRLIQEEADGSRLTEIELLQNCIFILNAGHETTTNLIGNALQLLIEWPDARAGLIAEPDLIKTAVDEFLRFESPNQLGNRRATRPTEIGGVALPEGAQLTLCIGAANRDPDQFPDPDRLDIARKPNRHLAFASGAHQCAGLSLAKLEAKVAISALLSRYPDYRPAGDPVRAQRARFRGFTTLPVSLA